MFGYFIFVILIWVWFGCFVRCIGVCDGFVLFLVYMSLLRGCFGLLVWLVVFVVGWCVFGGV